jgi:MFS family permease
MGAATAAIIDLADPERRPLATLVATAANIGGLGLGSLSSGLLTHIGSSPLRLPFIVHLCLLVPAAIGIWLMPETVRRTGGSPPPARLRPGIPPEVRPLFAAVSIAVIPGFAVIGVFGSVTPAFLGQTLGHRDPALAGATAFLLLGCSVLGQALSSRLPVRGAFITGVIGVSTGLALLAAALPTASLPLFLAGGAICGLGQGVSFRAGLTVLSAAAPAHRRAETASSFFVVGYVGTAWPVLSLGFLAAELGLLTAGLIVLLALAAVGLAALALLRREGAGHAATSAS